MNAPSKTILDPIPMDEICLKLADLSAFVPKLNDLWYGFAAFIATKLADKEFNPQDFYWTCYHSLQDLKSGFDRKTGDAIHHSLAGLDPLLYSIMWLIFPEVMNSILPNEFGREVEKLYNQEILVANC